MAILYKAVLSPSKLYRPLQVPRCRASPGTVPPPAAGPGPSNPGAPPPCWSLPPAAQLATAVLGPGTCQEKGWHQASFESSVCSPLDPSGSPHPPLVLACLLLQKFLALQCRLFQLVLQPLQPGTQLLSPQHGLLQILRWAEWTQCPWEARHPHPGGQRVRGSGY